MNQPQVMQLTTTLKGCPLSCFFAFLLLPPPLSPKELVLITSYNIKTVRIALHKLKSVGLAATTGNERWMLTDEGYQLPLSTENAHLAPKQAKEVKNSPLLPRSSSLYTDSSKTTHDKEQQLQDEKREKITSLLVQALVKECVCPTSLAEITIREALALSSLKGNRIELEALYIEYDIYRWLAWCRDKKWGDGIKNVGVFIASKIKNMESPPDWFEQEFADEIYDKLLEIEKQIAKELDNES